MGPVVHRDSMMGLGFRGLGFRGLGFRDPREVHREKSGTPPQSPTKRF